MVQSPLVWVTGTSSRFNNIAKSMDGSKPQTDNEAVPTSNRCSAEFVARIRKLESALARIFDSDRTSREARHG